MNGISFGTLRTVRNTVDVRISGVSTERGATVYQVCSHSISPFCTSLDFVPFAINTVFGSEGGRYDSISFMSFIGRGAAPDTSVVLSGSLLKHCETWRNRNYKD